jgi:hypothetical protein
MTDILLRLDGLRRPHLLIRAARIGAEEYRRDIHLPRLLGRGALPRTLAALEQLMELEAAQDAARLRDEAGYSVMRHVEMMIAVIGEARILRATSPGVPRPVLPGLMPVAEARP